MLSNEEYTKFHKLGDKSLQKMQEHLFDGDDSAYMYWGKISIYCTKKCYEIPLH